MRTIMPVIMVTGKNRTFVGEGLEVRDFRPGYQGVDTEVKGPVEVEAPANPASQAMESALETGADGDGPKGVTSSAQGSASESAEGDKGKLTPDSSPESNPEPPSISLLLPTENPASAAKEKSQHPSRLTGKPAPPVAE